MTSKAKASVQRVAPGTVQAAVQNLTFVPGTVRTFRRNLTFVLPALCLSAFLSGGCLSGEEARYSSRGGWNRYERVRSDYRQPAARSRSEGSLKGFGYVSGGWIAYADFSDGLTGVEPGTGYTVTIPPLVPVAVLCSVFELFGNAYSVISGEGDVTWVSDDFWRWDPSHMCGVTDPSASPVCEVSVDLTFSRSHHEDQAHGGSLTHNSILLGIRAAARTRHVRGYLSTGCGRHSLHPTGARPRVKGAWGPYVGLGLEVLAGRNLALGVDAKGLLFSGRDVAGGRARATARQIAVSATVYW